MSNSVNSSGCSYKSLLNYNGWENVINNQDNKNKNVIIPVFGSPGYEVLTGGFQERSDSGYFCLKKAYGKSENCNSCNFDNY